MKTTKNKFPKWLHSILVHLKENEECYAHFTKEQMLSLDTDSNTILAYIKITKVTKKE